MDSNNNNKPFKHSIDFILGIDETKQNKRKRNMAIKSNKLNRNESNDQFISSSEEDEDILYKKSKNAAKIQS